jgi:hypothetical protein
MNPTRSIKTTLASLLLSGLVPACSGEGQSSVQETGVTSDPGGVMTFEQYMAGHVRPSSYGYGYEVEGDIFLPDLAAVREEYESSLTNPGALLVKKLSSGGDNTWSRADRAAIKYCIDKVSAKDQYDRIRHAMWKATNAWETAADVNFIHVVTEDDDCTKTNPNVKFDIWVDPTATGGLMGYPRHARKDLHLRLGDVGGETPGEDPWADDYLLAVLLHELGHSLGFPHEHARHAADDGACKAESASTFRVLTPHDNVSAMHYTSCSDWGDPLHAWNFLSQWDIEGAQSVYEAPTNVVNASDGTVYARKRSTGDFYRRSSAGSWTKIGGPGQAFLTVGNTLYGQRPGRGEPVKYNSGTSWTTIGDAAGQIFECAGAVCATNPTTQDVFRYSPSSGSWTKIGGPGSYFRATDTKLFGITPFQDGVAQWSGSGASWSIVGNAATQLFGGGTSMYRLDEERDAIEKYSSGSTWTKIGSNIAGVHASGGSVYLLGGSVFKYSGSGQNWTNIRPAAARLYGAYGKLYVTTLSTEDIEVYSGSGSSWTSLGKP